MAGSSNNKENLLTKSQFMFILFGGVVGSGIISLPNDVVKVAHQDGWISTAIGGLYPLYIVLIGAYLSKNSPKDSILVLSKKCLGIFLGSILNFIFLTSFIYYATMITSVYVNLAGNFVVGFLTPIKMIIIIFLIALYTAFKGLKVLGKINEITFYIMIVLLLSATPALRVANIQNVCPVFDAGLKTILQGSIPAAFAYSGAEIIFLICPFMKEKNKVFSSSIIIVALIIALYVWCVFITIYYLGPDIVTKSYWSFLLVSQSVTITVINNYRYVFIFFWSLLALKSCSVNCYASIYILKDFIKKIETKKLCFFIYPIFIFITFKFGNEISRQQVSKYATQSYVIFDLLYITIISIVVFLKKGEIN